MIRLFQKGCVATAPAERRFIALIPLATYGAGATIGNGQLAVHLIPALLGGILLLRDHNTGWQKDIMAVCLLLFALVKPSIAAPFFWIILIIPGRIRPACLLILFYLILTLLAALINHTSPVSLFLSWTEGGINAASWASIKYDKANIHALMYTLGHPEINPIVSLFLLFGLGIWVFLNRRDNVWILIGISALVARFWTYHGWYDDFLILLPMIALYRIANYDPEVSSRSITAGFLFALTLLSIMAPGGRYLFPEPWNMVYIFGQIGVWMIDLFFLLAVSTNKKSICKEIA
jgi:hypothetical protein